MRNLRGAERQKEVNAVKVKIPATVKRGSELEESFLAVLRLYRLPEPEREVLYAPPRKVRCDFLFRQAGLIVEMEGGVWSRGKTGHNSGSGIEHDCLRSRLASLHGLKVYRITRKALDENPGELMEQIGAILSRWSAPESAAEGAGHPSYTGPNGDGEHR